MTTHLMCPFCKEIFFIDNEEDFDKYREHIYECEKIIRGMNDENDNIDKLRDDTKRCCTTTTQRL